MAIIKGFKNFIKYVQDTEPDDEYIEIGDLWYDGIDVDIFDTTG